MSTLKENAVLDQQVSSFLNNDRVKSSGETEDSTIETNTAVANDDVMMIQINNSTGSETNFSKARKDADIRPQEIALKLNKKGVEFSTQQEEGNNPNEIAIRPQKEVEGMKLNSIIAATCADMEHELRNLLQMETRIINLVRNQNKTGHNLSRKPQSKRQRLSSIDLKGLNSL